VPTCVIAFVIFLILIVLLLIIIARGPSSIALLTTTLQHSTAQLCQSISRQDSRRKQPSSGTLKQL
jgi:hypothetical protein